MAGMGNRIMKLNKIIGMTAALLVGAGMTSAVMADNDRGHRGGKRGEHAKRGQDRQGNASDRIAEIKKRAMAAKKRVAAKGGQRRGPQGGPPQFAREMMKKRVAAAKGGRGQAGPPQHVLEMWKKRREAAGRGGCGPQARGGFKGFGGPRGPQALGGHRGPQDSKGRQARGSRDNHRDSKGRHSRRGARRGHRR